eukprot:8628552-Alexandrium_andersonii.AAC.1
MPRGSRRGGHSLGSHCGLRMQCGPRKPPGRSASSGWCRGDRLARVNGEPPEGARPPKYSDG